MRPFKLTGWLLPPALMLLLVNSLGLGLDQADAREAPAQWLQQRGMVNRIQPMAAPEPEPRTWDGRLTARAIQGSIDDAVLYLRRQVNPDGSVGPRGYQSDGATALTALALLAAGGHPVADPELSRILAYLARLETDNTYVRAVRANVWEYALRKLPGVDPWWSALEADFQWLLKAHNGQGWRYTSTSKDWDNSCTQYGVLGIWAGLRAGLRPPAALWTKLADHFLEHQNQDGGWSYITGGSTANMATAGLASLFLVFDASHGKQPWRRGQTEPAEATRVLAAIDRGLGWLAAHEGHGKQDAYYLYGVERVAVAGGRKYLGGEDWFAEGARVVLSAQRSDGSLPLGRGPVVGTALSTLFMVYGGAPVAFDKLAFGDDADWNRNPRDLANLTRSLWSAYERPLNWHTVRLSDPVEEFEAPILFLSGSRAPKLSAADHALLRRYVARGGTLLAEAADGAPEFTAAMEALAAALFPDAPLAPLTADHPLYTVIKQPWQTRPPLRGVEQGGRTVFLISDSYLAGAWQADDQESDAFKLATNLLLYATDRAALQGRFSDIPEGPPAVTRGALSPNPLSASGLRAGALTVGVFGVGVDATESWLRAADALHHQTGARPEPRPVALTHLDGVDLLHLTGRGPWQPSPQEIAGLQAFVHGGGRVLVDAWGGDPRFAASARALLETHLDGLAPLDSGHPLTLGQYAGGVDLSQTRLTLAARRQLRRAGALVHGPQLALAGAGRVVFSPFDLAAALGAVPVFEAAGYTPAAARQIVGNLLAWPAS